MGWGHLILEAPLISVTTGTNLKIQTAFDSHGKTVEGKYILTHTPLAPQIFHRFWEWGGGGAINEHPRLSRLRFRYP